MLCKYRTINERIMNERGMYNYCIHNPTWSMCALINAFTSRIPSITLEQEFMTTKQVKIQTQNTGYIKCNLTEKTKHALTESPQDDIIRISIVSTARCILLL